MYTPQESPETVEDRGEIMQFTVAGSLYGLPVEKVREILVSAPVKPMPRVHPAVEGVYKPRDTLLTVVDLPLYLTGEAWPKGPKDLFIVTEYEEMNLALRVHTVVGICRPGAEALHRPDAAVSGGEPGITAAIAGEGRDLVTILDMDAVAREICSPLPLFGGTQTPEDQPEEGEQTEQTPEQPPETEDQNQTAAETDRG